MPACINCHRFDNQDQLCTIKQGSPIRKCVIALLEKECEHLRKMRVLEIGCGGWDFAKSILEANGCEWFGVEPQLVDEKGRPSIATHQGSVTKLPFENNFFDYVLGNQTLEHWYEFKVSFSKAFREIYRVLKPGGTISMNVPIHLHGYPFFVKGDISGILELFNPNLWQNVRYEPWRKSYEPLQPFRGWRLNGISDKVLIRSQQQPSSWIMQIQAEKEEISYIRSTADTSKRKGLKMKFKTNFIYTDRQTKARYVYLKYQPILVNNILDVGADACYLKQYLGKDVSYWGIGLDGNVDQQINLEKGPFPFEDNSFDCVLSLDTLEHLDNIHNVFDELCRVSRKYVIISLPNPYSAFWNYLRHGDYNEHQHMKFYGLPQEKTEDRHKWFFSPEEAERFIHYRGRKNNMEIVQLDYFSSYSTRSLIKKLVIRYLLRKDIDLKNLYTGTLWAVLEKGKSV